jgi:hypothetical protein
MDKPAQPANVKVDAGQMSVQADNSSLTQILHDISAKTGMTIDGLNKDQRVFGSYGPSNPKEILSALLAGTGYNVMMVGVAREGAPRELVLTERTTGAAAQAGNSRPNVHQNQDDEDSVEDSSPNPPDLNPPQQPPQPGVVPPDQPATPPNGVKTPQQMLQELQQLRQQQQQQQQSPQ